MKTMNQTLLASSNGPFQLPGKSIDNEPAARLFEKAPLAAFAGSFLGCFTTLIFSACGVVPSAASALATVLLSGPFLVMRTDGIVAGAFFSALYGGTFAGMTRMTWLGGAVRENLPILTIPLFISLSVVCGLTAWRRSRQRRSPARRCDRSRRSWRSAGRRECHGPRVYAGTAKARLRQAS
jgi:hypothetical protein